MTEDEKLNVEPINANKGQYNELLEELNKANAKIRSIKDIVNGRYTAAIKIDLIKNAIKTWSIG
jgi:hypothetical protein